MIRLKSALSTLSLISSMMPLCASAATCRAPLPSDYLVFSATDITYSGSDFQGLTGAGGNVNLDSFAVVSQDPSICKALIAGNNVTLTDGSVDRGGIAAGGVTRTTRVGVDGRIASQSSSAEVLGLSEVSQFFSEKSATLAALPSSASPVFRPDGTLLNGNGLTVFNLTMNDLTANSIIYLMGDTNTVMIINIAGYSVSINSMDIELRGGLQPERVIFNFPNATQLTLTHSGSQAYGIPGTVLAPFADTNFTSGLVTGGLYVGKLCGDGQVNSAKTQWPELGLPTSQCGCSLN